MDASSCVREPECRRYITDSPKGWRESVCVGEVVVTRWQSTFGR